MVLVEKHPSSKKEYKPIVLANGLTVLLIRDPISDFAGASMVVRGGSFSDTKNAPGANHLLEHMLFKGSRNFPGENEFSEFISMNGGDDNAFVEMEFSMYSMTVAEPMLEKALKMFSEFFHCPLFNIGSIEAELAAIENEFESKRQDDLSRLEHLKGHTALESHLFNRFGWGNRESFSRFSPKKLRRLLFTLSNKLFVGGSMHLVVSGSASFEDLERMVTSYFSPIKRGPRLSRKANANLQVPIWPPTQFVQSEAVGDVDILDVFWRISPLTFDREKPEVYVKIALGHRGEGSLFSLLKKKGWVYSVEVMVDDGGAYDCTSFGRLFTIRLELSRDGLKKIYEIIEFIYDFLKFLGKKHSPNLMNEYKRRKDFEYETFEGEGTSTQEFLETIADNMFYYPVEKCISAPFEIGAVSEFKIKELLTYFISSNMRLHLVTKSFTEDSDTKIDPWFNILYKLEDIPSLWKQRWSSIPEPYAGFKLPQKNEYFPLVLDPIDSEDENPIINDSDVWDEDGFLLVNSSTRLKHTFSASSSTFNFCVQLDVESDIKSQASSLLFMHLLNDSFDNITYKASQAGFETSVVFDANKILFSLIGFPETIPFFETFEIQKEAFIARFKRDVADVQKQAEMLMDANLLKSAYSFRSTLDLLEKIKFEDLTTFITSLRSKVLIDVISFGDIPFEHAKMISKCLKAKPLRNKPPCYGVKPVQDVLEVGEDAFSKTERNSHVKVIYQIGLMPNAEHTSYLLVLNEIIKEHTFNTLRNKEKLGYLACSHVLCIGGVDHLLIEVSSSEFNSTILKEKIIAYADSLGEYLGRVSVSRFEKHKTVAIHSLPSEEKSFWVQVVENRCAVDFYDTVIEDIIKMEQADLKLFYLDYIKGASNMVVVSVRGCTKEYCAGSKRPREV